MEQQHVVAQDGRPEADDSDLLQGVGSDPAPSRTGRVLAVVGGTALLLVGLYAAAQWYVADKVPRGTTVAGVALGGLDVHAAEQKLADGLADRAAQPVKVVAGRTTVRLDPAATGLHVDAAATVEPLATFGLSPQRLWHAAFGGSDVAPVVQVDDAKMDARLAAVAKKAAVAPRDGDVQLVDGTATSTAPRAGTALDAAGARAALTSSWLRTDGPITLPVTAVAPRIGDDAVQDALVVAGTLTSAPVALTVGSAHVNLPPDVLAGAASFTADGSALKLTLDPATLRRTVLARAPHAVKAPRDATIAFVKGKPTVKDGRDGTTVDGAALVAAVSPAATSRQDRKATVALTVKKPAVTAEKLRALGITERVSAFDTALTSDTVRTANLRTGAAKVNDTLVEPGKTFSMLDALGPITLAAGYHEAHVISDGQLVDGIGGGLSQMATTTYNAAFFAGLDIVTHKPHSFYISRYPEGREATLAVPSVDMQFTNDTPYGVVVRSWISKDDRLHVALWSTPYYKVSTTTSARSGVVPGRTIRNASPSCVADPGGEPGFTVSVRRVVSRLDGTQVKDETNRWTYNPENTVICTKGD